jgi:hypothetical protein
MRRFKQTVHSLVVLCAVVLLLPGAALADSSSSANYRVDQTFFGSGGELNACSGQYCAKQTAGELGVGKTCSAGYCAQAGFNTTDDPFLEFVVTGANIDLGYLDTGSAKTANGTFVVRAWQAGGYVVRTEAEPPTNTSNPTKQINPLAAPTASSPGTEQFGINLVANTSPTTFGANPAQVPDSTFAFGQAATGYDTADVFKYVKGDTVAESTESTSITNYTVSYIFNISNDTESGGFTFRHVLVATGTY